jgi:hypothetical protein
MKLLGSRTKRHYRPGNHPLYVKPLNVMDPFAVPAYRNSRKQIKLISWRQNPLQLLNTSGSEMHCCLVGAVLSEITLRTRFEARFRWHSTNQSLQLTSWCSPHTWISRPNFLLPSVNGTLWVLTSGAHFGHAWAVSSTGWVWISQWDNKDPTASVVWSPALTRDSDWWRILNSGATHCSFTWDCLYDNTLQIWQQKRVMLRICGAYQPCGSRVCMFLSWDSDWIPPRSLADV